MTKRSLRHSTVAIAGLALLACLSATQATAASQGIKPAYQNSDNDYKVTKLVSNLPDPAAAVIDPNLVNPWGLSYSPTDAFWVSDNGSGLSTLYSGTGAIVPLVVTVPGPTATTTGSPTGQVYNGSSDFVVTKGNITGPAVFIFDSEDGTISGWNPASTTAITAVDRSATGAVYKGLALVHSLFGNALYATNFNSGAVDVFDAHFAYLGSFTDPDVPAGYAPFGIANVNGSLVVTFALQDAAKHDDVPGHGHGYVDVFSADGTLIRRLTSGGPLNSPWGIALAPSGFGAFSNTLLIGNFGDGHISGYDFANGDLVGQLINHSGHPLLIHGLWGLEFGNGGGAGPVTTLYYTGGANHEANGVFGSITFTAPVTATHRGDK